MATSSNARSNTPVIVAIAVAVIGILLYLLTRGSAPGGGDGAGAPNPPAKLQGKAAKMATTPGQAVVLKTPRVTKVAAGGELGKGKTGWAVEIAYSWKDQLDNEMTFRAPYRTPKPGERSGLALPAKGMQRPAAATSDVASKGGNTATNAAAPATSTAPDAEPTFLLPQKSGKVRLLIPNNPDLKMKKGDKLTISLQAVSGTWMIPATNEIVLPPLP